ncbi:MAG: hypothetical protein LBT23_10515 [Synergistaceae bacterium]|jgi:phage protein D|nr:hypothetical protein [Synergistaceae bacterium]
MDETGKYDPRQTRIELIYEGADISKDIAPFLLSFNYDDKSSGESDDLQITLEDRDGLWRDPWYPSKGERITASIITANWKNPGEHLSLYCGSFEIDEVEISEPPMTVNIKAVSAPRSTSMRGETKSRNWDGYKLSGIANDVAHSAGMNLEYLASSNPLYDTRSQASISDMKFLMKLCTDAGLALKVTDSKIVIFDEAEFEGMDPVMVLARGDGRIVSMNIKTKMAGTYKAAEVQYSDTEADETHFGVYAEDGIEESEQVLRINQRVKSRKEADELAQSKLHEANKNETTGSFNLQGELGLAAGSNIEIIGWGKFDGIYFIESAKHSYGGSGYTTSISIREGGPSKKKKKEKKKSGGTPAGGKVASEEFPVYQ